MTPAGKRFEEGRLDRSDIVDLGVANHADNFATAAVRHNRLSDGAPARPVTARHAFVDDDVFASAIFVDEVAAGDQRDAEHLEVTCVGGYGGGLNRSLFFPARKLKARDAAAVGEGRERGDSDAY